MSGDVTSERRRAASMARDVIAGRLDWRAFMNEWGENEDELIAEVYDLLEHEPQRGGFLGVNEKSWQEYEAIRQMALARLESGS
jgi:hypothetical protein